MTTASLVLHTAGGELPMGGRPMLMGIVNATPDSFSDVGLSRTLSARLQRARELVQAGASIIDIGGESGVTNRPPVTPEEEIERVLPVIAAVHSELDVPISVDTYKPLVARAAIGAGAAIVNDVSGLRDPELAEVCAETGAGLVVMHTRAEPKQKLLDPGLDDVVVDDVRRFLEGRVELAVARGVAFEQLMLDPGPDFGKTPFQTIQVLRALPGLRQLGRPILLAVSRKDFVGALLERGPTERQAGTLAAVGHGIRAGANVLRVHDVAATADYLTVAGALDGSLEVDSGLHLAEHLRRTQ